MTASGLLLISSLGENSIKLNRPSESPSNRGGWRLPRALGPVARMSYLAVELGARNIRHMGLTWLGLARYAQPCLYNTAWRVDLYKQYNIVPFRGHVLRSSIATIPFFVFPEVARFLRASRNLLVRWV